MRRWARVGLFYASGCAEVGAPPDLVEATGAAAPATTGDGSSDGSSGTTEVDRAPSPDAPALVATDRFATHADTELSMTAGDGVLANDVGLDLRVVDHDAHTEQGGTLTIDVDGALVYAPLAGFGGCDRARYVVADARGEEHFADIVIAVHRGGVLGSPHPVASIAAPSRASACSRRPRVIAQAVQ